jgi:hypothetical protein
MAPKKKEPDNKPSTYKLCAEGHKNSPTAKWCWVCNGTFDAPAPKPVFIQKTNTVVHNIPVNLNDVNKVVPGECERYVGKRERCDDKDPTGHLCTFFANCVTRLKRYNVKPAIDVDSAAQTT